MPEVEGNTETEAETEQDDLEGLEGLAYFLGGGVCALGSTTEGLDGVEAPACSMGGAANAGEGMEGVDGSASSGSGLEGSVGAALGLVGEVVYSRHRDLHFRSHPLA